MLLIGKKKISNIEVSLFPKESKISMHVYMKEYVIFKTIALCLNRFTMFHTNWLNILFSWRYNNYVILHLLGRVSLYHMRGKQ